MPCCPLGGRGHTAAQSPGREEHPFRVEMKSELRAEPGSPAVAA